MKPGDVLADRFVIERVTAAGGMGVVWRASDRHTDGLAAVKVVATRDAGGVERFVREARALAELHHPGIVQYLAHGRSADGELYLATEWLDGEDLHSRLARAELTGEEALEVATQVAAALAVAHGRQVIHRDVKPSNIFLCNFRTGRIKLLDFGVARLARLEPLTATGCIVGTPIYMAPEQARGARDLDARADVYALGAVLFRCLTGRPMFLGTTPGEVLEQVIYQTAPSVRSLAPHVPPDIDALVARMVARDRDSRPRDAAAVLAELIRLGATEIGRWSRPLRSELTSAERRIQCVLALVGGVTDEQCAVAAAYQCSLDESDGCAVGVLAGVRVATDQVQLAARCARALVAAAPGARAALVTGRSATGQSAPADELLHERARRLADLPAVNDAPAPVRIDESTAGLLGPRFEVVGDAAGLAIVGERDIDDDARSLLGRAVPIVGRDRELDLLEGIFRDAVESRSARVVLVTAPAGMGKTRLRLELVQRLRADPSPAEVWTGHGDPMRVGAPFGLIGEAVRRAAGVEGSEPLAMQQKLLTSRVARRVPAADARRVAEFLGELCGVPFDASPLLRAARRDPVILAEQMRTALAEWLDAECSAQPVVIVLEDLHWGDLPTVKAIDHVLQGLAERPLVVLGIARPEVHDLFPRLWSDRGLQEIHLGVLSRKACERLVRAALGDEADSTLVADLVVRAAGNAFYLEELVRQEAAGIREGLPETVLAMVAARFDAMEPEARRVLRAASIFGEIFWADGVSALLGGPGAALGSQPIDFWLGELVEREVIARRHRPRFADEQELGFRHSLLREAAYAMLTDADRVLGHRLAAEWLERAGEPEAVVLADHYERGGELSRAATLALRAAEQAMAGGDPEAAIARAERGVSCGAAGELYGALRIAQAEAHRVRGDNEAAERASRAAMAVLPPTSDAWWVAAGEATAAAGKLYNVAELLELGRLLAEARAAAGMSGRRAVALARAATQFFLCGQMATGDALLGQLAVGPGELTYDPVVHAHTATAFAYQALAAARWTAAATYLQEAVAAFEEAGDVGGACAEQAMLVYAELWLGRLDEAMSMAEEVVPRAECLGLFSAAMLARSLGALAGAWQGDTRRALALARGSPVLYPALTQPRIISFWQLARAEICRADGDSDGAERYLRIACGRGVYPNIVQPMLARVLVARGSPREALAHADEGLDWLRDSPGCHLNLLENLLARAEALIALADPEADAAAARAADGLRAALAEIADPVLRATCRDRVPTNAAIVRLAEARGLEPIR